VVHGLKKTQLAIVLVSFYVLSILLATATLSQTANASPSPASFDVKVQHMVEVKNSGLLVINDTLRLSAISESVVLNNYTFGFPYAHRSNLDYAFAYETSNPSVQLRLELDVGLGRAGFYGVSVDFLRAVNITSGPYEFTVVFVFSNVVSPTEDSGTIYYTASFPAYPSLTQTASEANISIVFPVGLDFVDTSYKEENINFRNATVGSKRYVISSPPKANLTEFSDQTAWFTLAKSTKGLATIEIKEVRRSIEVFDEGQISVFDSYSLENRGAENLTQVEAKLPPDAFSIHAFDDYGLIPDSNLLIVKSGAYTSTTITLPISIEEGTEGRFSVSFLLPGRNYTDAESLSSFHVSLTLFEDYDWTIRKLTTTIILPEGAAVISMPSSTGLSNVQDDAFRESLTFVFYNATPFHDLSFDFSYGRSVLWDSFRPTLWMSAIVAVAGAIVGVWRVYRPAAAPLPTAIVRVRAEDLRRFVDSYEEKMRYQREIESLETQVRKGKIPRRNYKVRKMTLDSRLVSVSRDLAGLREKIRTTGPRYADLMRQLEVAETELKSVEADINRAEVGYRRGELSPTAYHNVLETSYRRRDRAQTTIEGVLLRLREEIT